MIQFSGHVSICMSNYMYVNTVPRACLNLNYSMLIIVVPLHFTLYLTCNKFFNYLNYRTCDFGLLEFCLEWTMLIQWLKKCIRFSPQINKICLIHIVVADGRVLGVIFNLPIDLYWNSFICTLHTAFFALSSESYQRTMENLVIN